MIADGGGVRVAGWHWTQAKKMLAQWAFAMVHRTCIWIVYAVFDQPVVEQMNQSLFSPFVTPTVGI